MRVALVGPPQSGKSTLFAAVAEAGGSHVDLSRPDQPHLAVVKVPDPRVDWLTEQFHTPKTIYAELEFLDLPGFDRSDDAGHARAKAHWSALRQCDMMALVLRTFTDPAVPIYRSRIDPAADLAELRDEMLFADLDQATQRVEKLEHALKKPTGKHDEQQRELDLMRRLVETLENERPISEAVANETEDKLIRSFAFLSHKPTLTVLNCDEAQLNEPTDDDTVRLSAKIEEEIAELPAEDRPAFLADLGVEATVRDRLIQACYRKLNLISFLTHGDDECRAWSIPDGVDAVTAAGEIHTDMARGFIRAETVAFDDLVAAGDMKAARAAGQVRLEGKSYVVRDGDVINFRFNV